VILPGVRSAHVKVWKVWEERGERGKYGLMSSRKRKVRISSCGIPFSSA
jgi:hypothetical protein